MQFAEDADLGARLGVDLTAAEQTRADALLTLASGLIQAEAGQVIGLVTDDVLTRHGTNDQTILLPERPVVSVASVTLDGAALDGWYLDGNELVRRGTLIAGYVYDDEVTFTPAFGLRRQELVITYTHGYAEIPEAIKAICLEATVRVWVNPGSVAREHYGSERIDYVVQGTVGGMMLTADEQRTIKRMFGRGAGAVWQS